jgi:hypothetical protein
MKTIAGITVDMSFARPHTQDNMNGALRITIDVSNARMMVTVRHQRSLIAIGTWNVKSA